MCELARRRGSDIACAIESVFARTLEVLWVAVAVARKVPPLEVLAPVAMRLQQLAQKWRQRSASVRRDAVCACVAAFPHYACARVCVGVRGGVGWGKGGNSHSVLPAALRTSVPTRTEPRAILDPHERQRARPLAASSTRLRGIPAAARRRHCASAPAVRGVRAERGGGGVRGGGGKGGRAPRPASGSATRALLRCCRELAVSRFESAMQCDGEHPSGRQNALRRRKAAGARERRRDTRRACAAWARARAPSPRPTPAPAAAPGRWLHAREAHELVTGRTPSASASASASARNARLAAARPAICAASHA